MVGSTGPESSHVRVIPDWSIVNTVERKGEGWRYLFDFRLSSTKSLENDKLFELV